MRTLRVMAGGAATIVILAVVAWAILLREAPKPAPPVAAPNEPWPGAAQLAGSWRQLQEQEYREANCRGRDGSFYHLTLEPPKELVPTIAGAMNVRLTRSGGEAACRRFDRRMTYDVSISPGPNSLLEMVMTATSCSEDGKDCPLVDRKIYFRHGPDVLLFGENRLTRVAR